MGVADAGDVVVAGGSLENIVCVTEGLLLVGCNGLGGCALTPDGPASDETSPAAIGEDGRRPLEDAGGIVGLAVGGAAGSSNRPSSE